MEVIESLRLAATYWTTGGQDPEPLENRQGQDRVQTSSTNREGSWNVTARQKGKSNIVKNLKIKSKPCL